jgi:iron complex transport system ATP-binding protein
MADWAEGVGPSRPPLFELRDVTVERDGATLLTDVTLRVDVGEHIAILGPNGAGKSSLLRTLTRELYPSRRRGALPTMRILGEERWDVSLLRRAFGMVSLDQLAGAPRTLRVGEVVLSGFFGSVGIWPHHAVTDSMRGAAAAVMERLGVAHLADRLVATLSAGEVRRVLIARGLVHGPRALLLDEPGSSLDVVALGELRRAMREVARGGTTLVLVTHHLSDIIPEIRRVVLMARGRIMGDGPREQVLTGPTLSALFGVPLSVGRQDEYDYLIH